MIHCIFCSLHFYIKKIEYCFLPYVTFLSRSELCHPWVPWSKAVKLLWMESSWVMYTRYLRRLNLFSLGFPFAKLLRNETQNFSFVAHQFCTKKQQFSQSFAKVISRKIALFRFFATRVLQFHNFVIIICVYFLELFSPVSEFWKNLVLECLAMGHFNLHNILD